MDELRGPTVQIVLHVKEGLGFGFLKSPFLVSGALNGYLLETDPMVPCHAPYFDAELVWEADKRRFRNLRVQNVPVKVEVFSTGTQGRKEKIGYLLLSLLGAQPRPNNKVVELKYVWYRLLGVKSAGKCCHPQLLLSLSVEDRISTPTPRNELRLFHNNEVAYPNRYGMNPPTVQSLNMTFNEYIAESKKTVTSPDLQPKLLCDEELIQIGEGNRTFVLSFVIGAAENVDLLLPEGAQNEGSDFFISYSVFTHEIFTDRVAACVAGAEAGRRAALFNQRSSVRVKSDLHYLAGYFAQCPHVVVKLACRDRDIGVTSMDLRKLIPTEDLKHFLDSFCNMENSLVISERCYLLAREPRSASGRRPYVDVDVSLTYVKEKPLSTRPNVLTARSATHLESDHRNLESEDKHITLDYKGTSCTQLDAEIGTAYTNITTSNTNRYRNALGEPCLQTNEITDLIKRMCDSFAQSQERLLASSLRPSTSDMQVQCEPIGGNDMGDAGQGDREEKMLDSGRETVNEDNHKKANNYQIENSIINKDTVKSFIPLAERDVIMQRFVDELEDWKEKQQELYKCQLIRKEEYHLELLSKEWAKKRLDLECKLNRGIEQCRSLAAELSRATEDFRLRGYRNTEREKKLSEAKKALEQHYTDKFSELREASLKMERDYQMQVDAKDRQIADLQNRVALLEKQVDVLKHNLKNSENDAENKYSGLTKDQTASLIQELRCLEEKLDSAVQSKAFFKEQWGRAVRELHFMKLDNRKQMLTQLHNNRRQLGGMGLDTALDQESNEKILELVDIGRLKDDFYVDILANSSNLEKDPVIGNSIDSDMLSEMRDTVKNPLNNKLNDLIAQRDTLIKEDNPDEAILKQLNYDIRNILLNCGN